MRTCSSDRKISSYDKFQALRRRPSYRADYWEFMFWCRENDIDETDYLDHPEAAKKAEELCQKYGITYLFNPSVNIPKHWGSGFFIEEKEIVEVLYPTEFRDLTEEEIEKGEKPRFLPIPIFSSGENLIIKINLKADKDALITKIIEQIDYCQWFISKSKSRMTSDRNVDKWKVWDIYNQTKSFEKTAEKINLIITNRLKFLSGIGIKEEAPQPVIVSTVRKAYYRAFELVYEEKFDPEKHKPEKLPVKLKRACEKCPESSTCNALCPQVLEYLKQDTKGYLGAYLCGEHIQEVPDPSSPEYDKIKKSSKAQKDSEYLMVVDKNLAGSPATCEKCGTVYFPSGKRDKKCPFCD